MMIRLLDEVLTLGDRGIALLTSGAQPLPQAAFRLRDARGNEHTVSRVESQEEWFSLFVEKGDAAYFERLFRDVQVDATAFEVVEPGQEAGNCATLPWGE